MKILGINTASKDSQIVYIADEINECRKLKDSHSENLLPNIEQLLIFNNDSIKNIDCFAVNVGPGSFTGIRIGVATIKAFMVALNKPCIIFNSFDMLSYNIKDKDYIITIDSGNNDFYFAIYQNGEMTSINVADFESIINIAKREDCKIYCLKDLEEIITPICERNLFKKMVYVSASNENLIYMIKAKYNNKEFSTIDKLVPIYIKQSQAEVSLNDKIKNGLIIEVCKDVDALYKIEQECFEDFWNKEIFKEELELADRFYYIAKVENEIVGYIGLWQTGDDLNLLKIAVLPRFRKLGIAEKLMQKAFSLKEEKNLDKFFLEVDEQNNKAINLYNKLGFKVEHKREKYYKNGDACLVMFYNGLKE